VNKESNFALSQNSAAKNKIGSKYQDWRQKKITLVTAICLLQVFESISFWAEADNL